MLRTAARRALSSSRAPSAARRVLVLDGLDPVCERHLNERGIETVAAASMSESALLDALPEFDGVVLQESTQITERVLSGAGERLKIVGRAGVTVSNVDLDAATKNGVMVMNTPGVETNATAEMSMALIMAVCRQVPAASRAMAADDWTGAAAALQGSELAGKTVGIVGLGRIGQKVAKWCDGFGMRVIAYDPVAKGKDMNVEAVSLDKIWTDSDIVSLHVPYSADTHHLVDEAAFARCKQGVRIINSAFGGAVKESALADALDSGKCGGAALDVFEGNPLACAPDSALRRLLDHPSVVCTPHIGAATAEARHMVAAQIATQMADALESGTYTGVVNSDIDPSVASAESGVAPYITLGECSFMYRYIYANRAHNLTRSPNIFDDSPASRLGAMHSQIFEGGGGKSAGGGGGGGGERAAGGASASLESIVLELRGEEVEGHATALQRAVLLGFLRERVAEPNRVNLLSVPSLAAEMGLAVTVKTGAATDGDRFPNTLTVSVTDKAGGVRRIAGTAFGRTVKIVEIDGYELDFVPDGHLTIFNHTNVPGVVAKFSSILGDRGVNISGLHVGSNGPDSGTSIAMLRTDDPVPAAVTRRMAELGDIEGIKTLALGEARASRSSAAASAPAAQARASVAYDIECEPAARPASAAFSSGPCAKRPGYGLPALRNAGECSFMYRYIVRESCSQFDSLPLTSLGFPGLR
jgi:phosphoglycerate dehydrogenase-like enzyme